MTTNLLKRREEALFNFISVIGIPVTTNECIIYLSQSNEIAYTSENRSSVLSSVFAILGVLEGNSKIKRYKREGTRDTVWYNQERLDWVNSTIATPMRKYIFDNFENVQNMSSNTLLKTINKSSEAAATFVSSIGDRKEALAMARADISRVSLLKIIIEQTAQEEAEDNFIVTETTTVNVTNSVTDIVSEIPVETMNGTDGPGF